MIRNIFTAAVATTLAATPALGQPGGARGSGAVNANPNAGANANVNVNTMGAPSSTALDARVNSRGPANASPTGIENAHPNSVLKTNTTTGNGPTTVRGMGKAQARANASPTGIENANPNSVLKDNTVIAGPLTGLTEGAQVQFDGTTVGSVQRIVTSSDGTVRRVLVIGTDGRIRSLSPDDLTLDGTILITTEFRM